jgi:hypothetical protein
MSRVPGNRSGFLAILATIDRLWVGCQWLAISGFWVGWFATRKLPLKVSQVVVIWSLVERADRFRSRAETLSKHSQSFPDSAGWDGPVSERESSAG